MTSPDPIELASRLVRMFSFVGDTVLDPFLGTGTTCLTASLSGRNSVGFELEPTYFALAVERLQQHHGGFFSSTRIEVFR
jgi:DNA modification methylase